MPETTTAQLSEGDGKNTSSLVPDSANSGTLGSQGQGPGPNAKKPGQPFGSNFENHEKRSPFVEMLMDRIKQRKAQSQSQEKQSMEITPQMLSAFQDELGYIRQEKVALLGTIGKSVLRVGSRAAKAVGAGERYAKGVTKALGRLEGKVQGPGQWARSANKATGARRLRKIVGGATLGAGALGAAGVGAAVS